MRIKGKMSAATEDAGLKGQSRIWKFSIFLLILGQSRVWKISILLLILGLALYIVGFSTPHFCELYGGEEPGADWNVTSTTEITEVNSGLWEIRREVSYNDRVLEVESENVTTDPSGDASTADDVMVDLESHFGLWRGCSEVLYDGHFVDGECMDVDDDIAWKPASKAMACVGLIFLIVGLFTAVVAGAWHNNKLMGFGGAMLLLGGVVAAIGCAVFIGEALQENSELSAGYSVYLALIGCLVLIVGGGLQFKAIKSDYMSIA